MRIWTGLAAGIVVSALAAFPSYAGHWGRDGSGWWWQEDRDPPGRAAPETAGRKPAGRP